MEVAHAIEMGGIREIGGSLKDEGTSLNAMSPPLSIHANSLLLISP